MYLILSNIVAVSQSMRIHSSQWSLVSLRATMAKSQTTESYVQRHHRQPWCRRTHLLVVCGVVVRSSRLSVVSSYAALGCLRCRRSFAALGCLLCRPSQPSVVCGTRATQGNTTDHQKLRWRQHMRCRTQLSVRRLQEGPDLIGDCVNVTDGRHVSGSVLTSRLSLSLSILTLFKLIINRKPNDVLSCRN